MIPLRPAKSPFSAAPWLCGLCCALCFVPAAADDRLIAPLEWAGPAPAPPAGARDARRVAVDAAELRGLAAGDAFSIQIAGTESVPLRVRDVGRYINGDFGISAVGTGPGARRSLTLTLGRRNLFAHVDDRGRDWLVHAVRTGDAWEGWAWRPAPLAAASWHNDYVIPDPRRDGPAAAPAGDALPLTADAAPSAAVRSGAAGSADVDPSNFRITHRFLDSPVIVDRPLRARVVFENIGAQTRAGLDVEFYFLLENTELVSAAPACAQRLSLSLQTVLHCDLGDFAPGQSKTVDYVVRTSRGSMPRVASAAIIGGLRVDDAVNVVEDVIVDRDGDGVSDFNEALAGTDPADAGSVDRSGSVIDVMALYTPGAAALYPGGIETRINQLIAVANRIYADSGVRITLRPVHHVGIAHDGGGDMDATLERLLSGAYGALAGPGGVRAHYGADLVMLFRPLEPAAARCGLAPIGGYRTGGYFDAETERARAYAVIGVDCPRDMVVAHELGHVMGLTHSHREDGSGGTFGFATGHGVDSQFVTVMAYPAAFGARTRIMRFSDPDADCLGFACGVDAAEPFGADAVKALNLVRRQIADYFPSTVPDLPVTTISTASGEGTSASIAFAASWNDGLTFDDTFSPQDSIDMVVRVQVDERHVGMDGSLHVLAGPHDRSTLYQSAPSGALVEWDGALDSLVPVGGRASLRREEWLMADGLRFGEDLVGRRLVLYIVYRVFETGEVVYTDTPFTLSIVPR